ncbi:hypothetical protein [Streptomyces minutiscleroticus]|uniref:hypothetical protein n=1 Tax=Streptomyces minutiscleroticus TaxID=68238 RepID=UPI0033310768
MTRTLRPHGSMMQKITFLLWGGPMRRHLDFIVLTTACLALAGCSGSDSADAEPAGSTPAATSSASAGASVADQIKACTEAIAAGEDSGAPECADLSAHDYGKALQDADDLGEDTLQELVDAASESAQP